MNSVANNFAKVFKTVREKNNKNILDFSNSIGLSVQEYEQYETMDNDNSFIILHKIANVYKIKTEKLWAQVLGKEKKKKADERWPVNEFFVKYNKENNETYKLNTQGESPDFHYKNDKGNLWAVEATSITIYNSKDRLYSPPEEIFKLLQETINKKDQDKTFINVMSGVSRRILVIDLDHPPYGLNWDILQEIVKNNQFVFPKGIIDICFATMYWPPERRYLIIKKEVGK